MAGFHSSLIYAVVTDVIRRVPDILRNRVIEKSEEHWFIDDLEYGNELCRGRMIPMSPQLITTVKSIYRKCLLDIQDPEDKTPVMFASYLGFADMVWGFIQCSKETDTDLHTQRWGGPEDFLWLQSRNGMTALDMAIQHKEWEVAKVLLSNATKRELKSAWDTNGKILFHLLHDHPIHDGFIFDMLEEDIRRVESGLPPIHNDQELVVDANRKYERRTNFQKFNMDLLQLINPDTDTYLHIVSKFGDVDYVKDVLERHPSLVSCPNFEGETPIYVAAREGHFDVLRIMVDHLKRFNQGIESLLIRPEDKHNALHIAIQNHHAPVVFFLLQEIPQLANQENIFKESPLYLASERSYFEIVLLILNKCRDKSFRGPNGKTAIHAAAISNSAECVKYLLLEWPDLQDRRDLVNKKDENGWTPWRYAVHYNSSLAMKELLNVDHSIGYQLVKEDNTLTSALHIAASQGHCETMKVLISICPGSREFDSKRRNILHIAIESKRTEVIEFIFQDESLTSLINQKDNNGNTPAHLLAESDFDMLEKVIDCRVNINSLNNENHTPLDMIAFNKKRDMIPSDEKRRRLIKALATRTNKSNEISLSSPKRRISEKLYEKELEGKQKKAEAHFKMVDNLVLVVTLIATATFAAAFTVPGGFDSDNGSKQGTPYLLRKAAFQAFVITNAIAFSCSCSVLLAHIWLLIYRNRYDEAGEREKTYIDGRIVFMYYLTGVALLSMLIAFVTGFYVVLLPSLWLAIFVCVLSIYIVVRFLNN